MPHGNRPSPTSFPMIAFDLPAPGAVPPNIVHLLPPSEVVAGILTMSRACHEQLQSAFACQHATVHRLTDSPDEADIIIAAVQNCGFGPCFEKLRCHEIYHRHARKLIVYCPDDNQFPALRGLYPSIRKHWVGRGWALPAHYISSHIRKFHFRENETRKKDVLFSFVGSSRTHPVRERILSLRHPGGVLVDSNPRTDAQRWWEKQNREDLFATFRDVTGRSRFVICPRGESPSSIRLFEAMEAGAVPVVVSDAIQLPHGPAWGDFSIRVPERKVDSIPGVVESFRDKAAAMGRAARAAWEQYFSDAATAATVVWWALQLVRTNSSRPLALRCAEYSSLRRLRAKIRHSRESLSR